MERTVEALEEELRSEHDLYLRALADFDNFRRRVDRERAHLGTEALRKFLLPLLDVIDDLERSLKAAETEKSPRFLQSARAAWAAAKNHSPPAGTSREERDRKLNDDWKRIEQIYARLPGFVGRPQRNQIWHWFGYDEATLPWLWASVEPPGLHIVGVTELTDWDAWNHALMADLAKSLLPFRDDC